MEDRKQKFPVFFTELRRLRAEQQGYHHPKTGHQYTTPFVSGACRQCVRVQGIKDGQQCVAQCLCLADDLQGFGHGVLFFLYGS